MAFRLALTPAALAWGGLFLTAGCKDDGDGDASGLHASGRPVSEVQVFVRASATGATTLSSETPDAAVTKVRGLTGTFTQTRTTFTAEDLTAATEVGRVAFTSVAVTVNGVSECDVALASTGHGSGRCRNPGVGNNPGTPNRPTNIMNNAGNDQAWSQDQTLDQRQNQTRQSTAPGPTATDSGANTGTLE